MPKRSKLSDEERKKRKAERSRRWYSANKDKARSPAKSEYLRWYNIEKKYGLTRTAWETLFSGQGCRCALCRSNTTDGSNWHTDHIHGTNIVRGILCSACNRGLGYFRDNPAFLRAGASYVEVHASG